jgi:hypothetical protein
MFSLQAAHWQGLVPGACMPRPEHRQLQDSREDYQATDALSLYIRYGWCEQQPPSRAAVDERAKSKTADERPTRVDGDGAPCFGKRKQLYRSRNLCCRIYSVPSRFLIWILQDCVQYAPELCIHVSPMTSELVSQRCLVRVSVAACLE